MGLRKRKNIYVKSSFLMFFQLGIHFVFTLYIFFVFLLFCFFASMKVLTQFWIHFFLLHFFYSALQYYILLLLVICYFSFFNISFIIIFFYFIINIYYQLVSICQLIGNFLLISSFITLKVCFVSPIISVLHYVFSKFLVSTCIGRNQEFFGRWVKVFKNFGLWSSLNGKFRNLFNEISLTLTCFFQAQNCSPYLNS